MSFPASRAFNFKGSHPGWIKEFIHTCEVNVPDLGQQVLLPVGAVPGRPRVAGVPLDLILHPLDVGAVLVGLGPVEVLLDGVLGHGGVLNVGGLAGDEADEPVEAVGVEAEHVGHAGGGEVLEVVVDALGDRADQLDVLTETGGGNTVKGENDRVKGCFVPQTGYNTV